MNKYLVVVAGGKGLRVGGAIPKQFLPIGGEPILMHTLRAMNGALAPKRIVVVLPESHMEHWRRICEGHHFDVPHEMVIGGDTRWQSVKNGLATLPDDGLVAIHDGVRPFVAVKVVQGCAEAAKEHGGAIPTLPLNDSLRQLDGDNSFIVHRSSYLAVQTPQIFRTAELKHAYERPYSEEYTDDAAVYEADGGVVSLIRGNRENIKITHSSDLLFANALLSSPMREKYS